MVSPLLRNLFSKIHSPAESKPEKSKPISTTNVAEQHGQPAISQRRLRSQGKAVGLGGMNNSQHSLASISGSPRFVRSVEVNQASSHPGRHTASTPNKSKPLPSLPSGVQDGKQKRNQKKRKLPRAITERHLLQPRSKLHMSAFPDHGADRLQDVQVPRYLTAQKSAGFQAELQNWGSATQNQSAELDHTMMEAFDGTQIDRSGAGPEVISNFVTSEGKHRQNSDSDGVTRRLATSSHRPVMSQQAPPMSHSASQTTITQISSGMNAQGEAIVETIETDSAMFCGHDAGFHSDHESVWACIDRQWNEQLAETNKTLRPNISPLTPSKSPEQSQEQTPEEEPEQARKQTFIPQNLSRIPQQPSSSLLAPPPSFRRSTARTSRMERLHTEILATPVTSKSSSVSLDISSSITNSSERSRQVTDSQRFPIRTSSLTPPKMSPVTPEVKGTNAKRGRSKSKIPRRRLERSPTSIFATYSPPRATTPTPPPRHLARAFSAAGSQTQLHDLSQSAEKDSTDFFTTYYDAMTGGTEHSWTLALQKSDLSDKAVADAYLTELPDEVLLNSLRQAKSLSESSSQLYSFGANAQVGPDANTGINHSNHSPRKTRRTVLQGKELRELELLSPIREESESQHSLLSSPLSKPKSPSSLPSNNQATQNHNNMSSPMLSTNETTPSSSVGASSSQPIYETTQCDPCRLARTKHASHPRCDKRLPACTACTTLNHTCTYRGIHPLTPSRRQHHLITLLATAGAVRHPFDAVFKRFRAPDSPAPVLRLHEALTAIMSTVRRLRDTLRAQVVDAHGVPLDDDALHAYYGGLALVAAAAWSLEAAVRREQTGVLLAAKSSRGDDAAREFCNRVYEVLGAFQGFGGREGEVRAEEGGVTLGVLAGCTGAVDAAMWRLWEQMAGGRDENGEVMSETIHWSVMMEVAREVLARGFVDAGKLQGLRDAVEVVGEMDWLMGTG
ncbi:hypothetical protein FH972_025945 [Carpinus fangiana]|uniref:Zn(2)-C6 fungal-type domain-containing protein n=1 Tax=Carpinus fangiana TaxID=176857 RepID=A0A5N6L2H5_9ROSI|nr:hypothetical protein FH972_025945 [Carpinus fangiana]